MEKSYLLQDPKTGRLWLSKYTYGENYLVETPSGIIDLAQFNEVVGEMISAHFFGVCMASSDVLILKNEEGLYTILTPYVDTTGYGAMYASICEGFPFKEIYGFGGMYEGYIVAKNADDKWGIYRITELWTKNYLDFGSDEYGNTFKGSSCTPLEIVRFEFDTMEDALSQICVHTPEDFEKHRIALPIKPQSLTIKQENTSLGDRLEEVQRIRKNGISTNIPQTKEALFEDMKDATNILSFTARYLTTPELASHVAQLFNISNKFLLKPENLSRFILSEYESWKQVSSKK